MTITRPLIGWPGANAVRRLLAAGLLWATIGLSSCVVHPSGQCGPACHRIEAASAVGMSAERLRLLSDIATQRDMSQHEQTYLVNAILYGGFGGEHAHALVTLIQNPCCTPETRKEIREQLRAVSFSNERKKVAEALDAAERRR